ncbi:hypothetical protein Vretimale_9622 [Volvox reticuliferus]|uniref:Uncharacterized protein n=1 Tax=Volvox reticuliferus TaxID=1737510 RepID=A0A8J4D4C6_9CHLO|nr:hypothetical protein Vretifemale_19227 [Volvox reticuliferus]GIM05173.1 hypothetical protein Vretimale_9622 [Volvox reticuliferus]
MRTTAATAQMRLLLALVLTLAVLAGSAVASVARSNGVTSETALTEPLELDVDRGVSRELLAKKPHKKHHQPPKSRGLLESVASGIESSLISQSSVLEAGHEAVTKRQLNAKKTHKKSPPTGKKPPAVKKPPPMGKKQSPPPATKKPSPSPK